MAEQQQIAAAVNQVRSAAETFSTNKREEAEQVLQQRQAELAIAKAQGDKAKEAQLQDQVDTAQKAVEDWGTGGKNRQAVDATLNGLGLALGGSSVEAVAAGAASPYVNTAIKHATEGSEWANLALHGVWGAVEAATQGANALGGAGSAVTGEVAAKILSEKLFGVTNPEALTEEQKRAVSHLSQMIAGTVSGGTELAQGGDAVSSVQNVNVGMGIAKNAVENNGLNKSEVKAAWDAYKACNGDVECQDKVIRETNELSKRNEEERILFTQSLVNEMGKELREAYRTCEESGGTQCQTALYNEIRQYYQEKLNAYEKLKSEGGSWDDLQKDFYPNGMDKAKALWNGMVAEGKDTVTFIGNVSDYVVNTPVGEMYDDAIHVGKQVLIMPEEFLKQDIPAHSIERALSSISSATGEDAGRAVFANVGGVPTITLGNKNMKWIKGRWTSAEHAVMEKATNEVNDVVSAAKKVEHETELLKKIGQNSDNYREGLNSRVSLGVKDRILTEHKLNKEAAKIAPIIKLPISDKVLEKHIINGEPKGNFFKGGHTTLGNVKVEKVVKEYANGVYEAKVSIPNPKALKDPNVKPFLEKSGKEKDSVSTMFPRTWNEDRLKVELAHAFKNGRLSKEGEQKWVGTTRSGVEVEWFFDKKGNISTVYPVRGQ